MTLLIMKGDTFGELTIIKELSQLKNRRRFECKCNCGTIKIVGLANMTSGNSISCGCNRVNMLQKRNKGYYSDSRIYNIWCNLKRRCNNKDDKDYGARGITYDKKWEKFEGFYEDMKDSYKDNLTIDRINNDGNYCKVNCKWSTHTEQMRNTRYNIQYKGKCLSEWCDDLGLPYGTVYTRISRGGKTIEEALELNNI